MTDHTNSIVIPDDEMDRFMREIVANSPDTGITSAELSAAQHEFVTMYFSVGSDTLHGAAVAMWQAGSFTFGWNGGITMHYPNGWRSVAQMEADGTAAGYEVSVLPAGHGSPVRMG